MKQRRHLAAEEGEGAQEQPAELEPAAPVAVVAVTVYY